MASGCASFWLAAMAKRSFSSRSIFVLFGNGKRAHNNVVTEQTRRRVLIFCTIFALVRLCVHVNVYEGV